MFVGFVILQQILFCPTIVDAHNLFDEMDVRIFLRFLAFLLVSFWHRCDDLETEENTTSWCNNLMGLRMDEVDVNKIDANVIL